MAEPLFATVTKHNAKSLALDVFTFVTGCFSCEWEQQLKLMKMKEEEEDSIAYTVYSLSHHHWHLGAIVGNT